MARAEAVGDLAIVLGALVDVLDVQAIGVPVVRPPSNTPDRIFTVSGSWRWVTKRDWPGRRLSSHTWMSASVRGCRRAAVDHAADRRAVAFAPGGEAEEGRRNCCRPWPGPASSTLLAFEVAEHLGDLLGRGRPLIMPTTW
jgi:hypothetical protein